MGVTASRTRLFRHPLPQPELPVSQLPPPQGGLSNDMQRVWLQAASILPLNLPNDCYFAELHVCLGLIVGGLHCFLSLILLHPAMFVVSPLLPAYDPCCR